MEKKYNANKIEKKLQLYWEKNKIFKVSENNKKKKFYCLSMLPYPSGKLHMGHVRNYTIGDVISRYQRMLGKNVLQPMGWDAFGLPAESAAINNKVDPKKWTYSNIKYMKKQLKNLGFSYDWDREITTCDPEYYRWEQWIFTKFYEKGLAYKKKSTVNWCPKHKTVLANEQVINNRCWRCDSAIEYKKISQWFIKITNYTEELLNGLNNLKNWPKEVKKMQKNWIGRTEGIEIKFKISNEKNQIKNIKIRELYIYTTQPEILMGVTYIAISPTHKLSTKITKENPRFLELIKKNFNLNTLKNINLKIKKRGIQTDFFAIHPITKDKIPIWITNFTHTKYGNNATIGVPGHNQDDWEFAKKNSINIKIVISDKNIKNVNSMNKAFVNYHDNNFLINSKEFTGMNKKNGKISIIKKLISKKLAKHKINYRIRDWVISRQRYWGAPIPAIILNDGTINMVSKEQLPIFPSKINDPNQKKTPVEKKNNKNKKTWKKESDTFDTFIESSWYYARYTCPHYKKGMLDPKSTNYWLPVDQYIGGIEHAIMHLLYFRFFHKFLRDIGLVNCDEPANKLLCQGMILSDSFYYIDQNNQKIWISPDEVKINKNEQGEIIKAIDKNGNSLIYAGTCKMSKSKNNGIDPQSIIEKYGADTIRLFIMFAAPPKLSLKWDESGIKGANRFIHRLWNFVYEHAKHKNTNTLNISTLTQEEKILWSNLNKTIEKVTHDFHKRYAFNTAIASIMQFVNELIHISKTVQYKPEFIQNSLSIIIRMLSPIIPHACFVMWKALGNQNDIDNAIWPTSNKEIRKNTTHIIIVQVNGKKRTFIQTNKNIPKTKLIQIALKKNNIKAYLKGKKIKKTIFIKTKILNFVTN